MADITMCRGIGCHQKDTCYRFTAEANEYRQSYFVKEPMQTPTECDHFWDTEEKLIEGN